MSALMLCPTSFTQSLLCSSVGVLLLGVSLVLAAENNPLGTTVSDESAQGAQSERLREGTKIVNQLGHFKITGDRAMFYTEDGKRQFGGLENLNLERIFRALSENRDQLVWSISGTITEYRGSNFLQIDRAELKTKNIRRPSSQPTVQPTAQRTPPPSQPSGGSQASRS